MLKIVAFAAVLAGLIEASEGRSNDSYEHQIRAFVLKNYDKIVRPEVKSNARTPITIRFGLKLNKLAKVNIKEETITVDTWVVMEWRNNFISWNKKNYGNTDKVNFATTEIWFPDISLINNANGHGSKAGGPHFFSSNVVVDDDGKTTWNGPATFTASCSMNLESWPFDNQECPLTFGSLTYGSPLLRIEEFRTKGGNGEGHSMLPEDSGNWHVNPVIKNTTTEVSFGDCCPFNFSQIKYTISMGRRFKYHMFYMVAPCSGLALLSVISFLIPSESGERIGFVTTLLLGMMVFLLIVPESLPESSISIPILGVLMMCTMIVIAFALLATIFVLRCYHCTERPPRCFQRIMKSCQLKKTEPSESIRDPKATSSEHDVKLTVVPSNESSQLSSTSAKSGLEQNNSWLSISEKLDQIFFWFFAILVMILYGSAIGAGTSNVKNEY